MTRLRARNFFINKAQHFESWSVYKRVILTGQVSLISLLVGVFYLCLDVFINHTYAVLYVYFIMITISLVSFFLNREGYHTLSKVLLLLNGNGAVFLTHEVEIPELATFIFFIPCILGSFTLFDYHERVRSYGFALLSIALFYISFYFDFDFLNDSMVNNEQSIELNFVMNFTITSLSCIFIISFLISINSKSEQALIDSSKELKFGKRRFELALRGSGAGIWDYNAVSDELYISKFLADMLGYKYELIQNISKEVFFEILHPDDVEAFLAHLEGHLAGKHPFKIECRLKRGDGSYIWILDSGQAQWSKKGKLLRMIGSMVNITERKESEKILHEQNLMLEKTNAELDRFVYSTSHDLRAPLSSMLGLINLAQLSDDPKEHKKLLSMMTDRIYTLNGFIGDIIDYSRNSRLKVAYEEIVLRDIVEESVENLRYFEQSELIDINYQNTDGIVFRGDRGRLKIVLNNMIANAIKYHNIDQDRPFVDISATCANGLVTIKVSDNGEGIESTYIEHIFDMFFRATEKSEGSGLGLYIAKEMVDKLHGKVEVQSEKGVGTTFTIILPAEPSQDSISKEPIA